MSTFRERIVALHRLRKELKAENRRPRSRRLAETDRAAILLKTDARCHICGGEIDGEWNADHVLPHSAGGEHSVDNYLPAHGTCNNYRWDYLPEEFQIILKLGVWARTQIQRGTGVGKDIEEKFSAHDAKREGRRKNGLSD